jgi:hypothetical protein
LRLIFGHSGANPAAAVNAKRRPPAGLKQKSRALPMPLRSRRTGMGVDCVGASMREYGHPSRAYVAGKRKLNEARRNMMGD